VDFLAYADNYFESLFRGISTPVSVILDDCHELEPGSPTQLILSSLLMNDHIKHICFVSRHQPSTVMKRALAGIEYDLMGWNDLRLDDSEIEGMIAYKGLAADDCLVDRIRQQTEGWVAGACLLLEQQKHRSVDTGSLGIEDADMVNEYLHRIMARMYEPGEEKLLSMISILPDFTIDEARRISRFEEIGELIQGLVRSNLFIATVGKRSDCFQLHTMFRTYLTKRFSESFSSEEIAVTISDAVYMLEEAARHEEVPDILVRFGNIQQLSNFIVKYAPLYAKTGMWTTIELWIELLPPDQVLDNPWILYWRGQCLLRRDFADARTLLVLASEAFHDNQDITGELLALSGIVDSFVFEWGAPGFDYAWIEKLENLARAFLNEVDYHTRFKVVTSIYSGMLFYRLDNPDIDAWSDCLKKMVFQTADSQERMYGAYLLMLDYGWFRGDATKAGVLMNLLARQVKDKEEPFTSMIWTVIETGHYRLQAQYDIALSAIDKGKAIGKSSGIHQFDFILLLSESIIYLDDGKIQRGLDILQYIGSTISSQPLVNVSYFHDAMAIQYAQQKKGIEAFEHAVLGMKAADESQTVLPKALTRISVAYSDYLCGGSDYPALLEEVRLIAEGAGSASLRYLSECIRTLILLDKSNTEAAIDSVKVAMYHGRRCGAHIHPWLGRIGLARLYDLALANNVETEYVLNSIRIRKLLPPAALDPRNRTWPWPVRLTTLGNLAIELYGVPLDLSGKTQKKPIDLLLALIASGGNQVSTETLGQLLWPESEYDKKVYQKLHTTMHRLKLMLGEDSAIIHKEGYFTLNRERCWVDAWVVENIAKSVSGFSSGAKSEITPEQIKVLAEQILSLYTGRSLNDYNGSLDLYTYREHLHQKFLNCVNALAGWYEKRCQYQQSINLYQQALSVDGMVEAFYRGLMRNHRSLGNTDQALASYQQCCEVLQRQFSTRPSAETESELKRLGISS